MFRLLRVSGHSLWPLYEDGDYVLAVHPRLARLSPGDVIVFRHPGIGLAIKRIDHILPDGRLFVLGSHDGSIDSRRFGPIDCSTLIGKVVWHIRRAHPTET